MNGIVDFHVHTSPSLMPRHHSDLEIGDVMSACGVDTYVLKAHEGSTAERAVLAGGGAIGSIVLNSPVGGANPDAVTVAARLGARVVWLPTTSAEAHQRAAASPELSVHRGNEFSTVPVTTDGKLRPEWYDVLDIVAEHDLILAAGHVSMDEAIETFRVAKRRGVQRLLVNHPMLEFLGWQEQRVSDLVELGAYIEVGVLADILAGGGDESATAYLTEIYPSSLLAFGSDLGHAHYPDTKEGLGEWLHSTAMRIGESRLERVLVDNGVDLLS